VAKIDVDDDVYEQLKGLAEPFVDNPSDVIRRLLRAVTPGAYALAKNSNDLEDETAEDEVVTDKSVRHVRGVTEFTFKEVRRTPDRDFRVPILRALEEFGGRASTSDVLDRVGELMRSDLKPIDFKPMQSGQIRWRSAANFERKHMALEREPLIDPNSPRGIWEMTEHGRRYLAQENARVNGN
jgi:predicted CopG family antitoxin